jgi:thioredoxin-like negative regulator of GroEL
MKAKISYRSVIWPITTGIISQFCFLNYLRLVREKSDAYIVLFLTIGPDRISQCPYCEVFKKMISYLARKEFPKNSQRHTSLYFSMLEYDASTQAIAQQLQARHVPAVYLLTPDSPDPISCDLSKQQIPEFLQQHTGYDDVDISQDELRAITAEHGGGGEGQGQSQEQSGNKQMFTMVWRSA